LPERNEIQEEQVLVVGNNTMSKVDWVKARVFAWQTSFLYYDKILQIPIILLHELEGTKYSDIFKKLFDCNKNEYPIIWSLLDFFTQKALNIQSGDSEYIHSKANLDIFWPADELALIIHDAVLLNKAMLQLPFLDSPIEVKMDYDIWRAYNRIIEGDVFLLERKNTTYKIDRSSAIMTNFDDFCRNVIWYGNKKGLYLYKNHINEI
jgi:hypothetical protein